MTAADRRAAITLGAALVIAVLLVAGVRLLGGLLPAPGSAAAAAGTDAALSILLFGLLAAVAIVAMRREGRIAERIGPTDARRIAIGATIGAGGLGTAVLLAALAGTVIRGGAAAAPLGVALGLVVIFVQTGAEELYFRGWLMGSLDRARGPWIGLVVSAMAFGLLHLAGGARAPLALVNVVLAGLLFGLMAQRSAGLAMPIAAHWAWNAGEGLVLGPDPNPGTGSYGALLDLDLVGVAAWGGSGEGLNASVAVSFALVALIVPLAAWSDAPASRLSRSGPRG